MNASGGQTRIVSGAMIAGLVVLSCTTMVLLYAKSKAESNLQDLKAMNRELREKAELKDQTISNLQVSVQRLEATTAEPQGPSPAALNAEFRGRMDKLSSIQTQTLAVIKAVAAKVGAAESPERQFKLQQAGVAMLEEQKARQDKNVAEQKNKVTELVSTLQIPDEAVGLSSEKALNNPGLRRYWPYFQAKRDLENVQYINEKLTMRLMQERVNLDLEGRVRKAE